MPSSKKYEVSDLGIKIDLSGKKFGRLTVIREKRTKLLEEYVKAKTKVSAVRAIMETDMDVGKKTDLVLKVVKGDGDADTYDVG